MNGYCGDCDKQVEFHKGTIKHKNNHENETVEIYLVCPWCEEEEYISEVSFK